MPRFASKTLQNDSKCAEKVQHHRFYATCVVFELFRSRKVGKRSTKVELIIKWAFIEFFADLVWKMAQNCPQKAENVEILSISDIFSEFLFEFENYR